MTLIQFHMGFVIIGFLFVILCGCSQTEKPVDMVDPFIQSANSRWFFFAPATRPFGMVNLGPNTHLEGAWNSGYRYQDSTIASFGHVHAWQLGGIAVMPTVSDLKITPGPHENPEAGYRSRYRHATEVASPGYYAVTLDDYQIRTELTSTMRVGFHRYHIQEPDTIHILFDLASPQGPSEMGEAFVEKVSATEIAGYSTNLPTRRRPKPYRVYFVARFSEPFDAFGGWQDTTIQSSISEITGDQIGGYVNYNLAEPTTIHMKVAISYVSIEQARLNLETELPHWDFDRVHTESREQWNQELQKIEVQGGTPAQRTKFYTDLWHVLLGRRTLNDVDGKYIDMTGDSPQVRQLPLNSEGDPEFSYYNTDAFWTTFWNINQIWSLVYPEKMEEWVNFLLTMYDDGGLIPRGPSGGNYTYVMVAAHSTPFIVSAYMKGIRGFDVEKAYKAMRKNHLPGGLMGKAGYEHDTFKGGGIEYYMDLGYIPVDRPEEEKSPGFHADGAGQTLEYAYDDWSLAQLARALGKTADHEMFMTRASNYRNLFDPGSNFMRPRNTDGTWLTPFDPLAPDDWVEANAWQYTWFVPHDVQGLINLMGGRERFTAKLDSAFQNAQKHDFISSDGYVNYDNQPSGAMAHLFNYSGAPWLTQKWVRRVYDSVFSGTTPETGYGGGDEDQGQQGGLSVLMALGLFETRGGAAVEPVYEITSPVFDKVTIHLNPEYYPGKTFVVETRNNSRENMYIQSATLDEKPLNKPWFYHSELVDGGKLILEMGPKPNQLWGSDPEDAPPSMSKARE